MDELILRHLSGEATDVEEHRFERWRTASVENEARYREMSALWEGLGTVARPGRIRRPDIDAMMAAAERRRTRGRWKHAGRAFLRSPWVAYGLAAAAVLVVALFGVRDWRAGEDVGVALSAVESSVGPGRVVAMTLSDGTFLRVAEGAKVDFPAEVGRREVVLEGRAFFAVASGESPFVVHTRAGDVRVHGTRFEVRTQGDELRVVVVEGTVEVIGPQGTTVLRAGQVATVRDGEAAEVVTVGDVWTLLDWPSGLLAFQRTPLGDVAGQLARHFGVDVRIEDSVAAGMRVTGSFEGDSLHQVVDAVCAVTAVRCEQRGDTVVVGVHR